MGTTSSYFEGGTDDAEHIEDETGYDADALGHPSVAVTVVDPVRIEEHPPRSITSGQVPIGTAPTQVVGELRQRASVTIAARGGDLYLGGSQVTVGSGFLLPMDAAITVDASCDIYAVAVAANTTTAHTLAQHRDG